MELIHKIFLALLGCLLIATTANAQVANDSPQIRFLTYVQQTYSVTLVNCSIQNQNDANLAQEITFPNGTPVATQNNIIADAQTNYAVWGGWSPLPVPDYNGFRHDVLTDASAPQYPLALLCCFLCADPTLSYNDRKTLATACATWIRAAYGTPTGNSIISGIQTYANNRHLPLQ